MRFLTDAVSGISGFRELDNYLKGALPGSAAACFGLSYIHRAAFAAALVDKGDTKLMLLVNSDAEAERITADLTSLSKRVVYFPQGDYSPRSTAKSLDFEHTRIGTLSAIADGAFDILVTTPAAAAQRTMPQAVLKKLTFSLRSGDEITIGELCKKLTDAGYVRSEKTDGAGQFAVRGSVADIFPPCSAWPYRLDFWGDEIDSISLFDPDTQRRTDAVDEAVIVPAAEVICEDASALAKRLIAASEKATNDKRREVLEKDASLLSNGVQVPLDRYIDMIYPSGDTLLDCFSGLTAVCDTAGMTESLCGAETLALEDAEILTAEGILDNSSGLYILRPDEFFERLSRNPIVYFESLPRSRFPVAPEKVFSFTLRSLSPIGSVSGLCEDLPAYSEYTTVIAAGERKSAESLSLVMEDNGIKASLTDEIPLGQKGVFITEGTLSEGIEIPEARFALLTYGRAAAAKRRSRYKKGEDIGSLDELHPGDAVVHSVHGIGIFEGIRRIDTKGIAQDYIRIRYRGTDVLYVPVTSLDMVSRYIGGGDEQSVKLSRLGSPEWSKTRARVRRAVKDIAKQLTELYAKRMKIKGFAFSPDTDLQNDFERRFSYEETGDQLRCVEEIKRDMESTVPMDRLLCGDVGFGKTEVALRAAFKCIADGKQCAVLVPTTILAWQHYTTACERFSGMPVNIEMLSRFVTPSRQAKIKKKLSEGNVDLIIGTHRLISSDIRFKDPGLLIIDEEQRFGVAQKEKLKENFPSVDVLTLSATPIPRTLNMALSGLRDMSSLEEAPQDRLPVQTYVTEYGEGMIAEAIHRELHRGGQVYYLHNRTEDIESVAARIKKHFPDNNVGVAHGKMSEEELSGVWQRLIEREIDILVCTTIIETGVDVPNVNTLIIEDADRFGLSQLHQLRGRVGRSHRRAYAYFLYRAGKALSDISQKRLEAIREFTEFGSGYKIAMRDLELRGAGSVLGGEQHGHMESVGYEMYLRLLNDALAEERGQTPPSREDCSVDIRSSARIPESYISDLSQRLEMYRRIAAVRTSDDALDVTDELIDRFGEPPSCVGELVNISLLKSRCIAAGFTDVSERNGKLVLSAPDIPQDIIFALCSAYGRRVETGESISAMGGGEKYISIKLQNGEKAFSLLEGALDAIDDIRSPSDKPSEGKE